MYGVEILHRGVVLLFVIFCCIAVKLVAQNPQPIQGTQVIIGKNALPTIDSLIAREIDAQVWRRFITTYNLFDAEGFNALHVRDVLRGGPWGLREWKIVQDWDASTIAGMPVTAEHFQKYAAKGILE